KTILDLNHFCYYELFKQIKNNCDKTNTLEEIKYADLISFIVCCKPFRELFYEWHKDFYKSFFLLYLSYVGDITIDFAELYTRLKNFPAKVKEVYFKSVYLALEENDNLTSVDLRYTPESYHSEHMEVFASVMNQLRRKKSLNTLRIHIPGYTIEELTGFGNLEELSLNVRVDIEELCRCCCNNKNLRYLTVSNSEMMGQRLADIVPYCNRVIRFDFQMKLDCDASEYAPLAKMERLEQLKIDGEHETGTLEPLLIALARKEPQLLKELSIDDALLDYTETTALSQIKLVNNLRCGFKDPQSIEPISQMIYLKDLEVLSNHTFLSISQQICRVLKESQWKKSIYSEDCLMDFDPKGKLRLVLNQVSASDYKSLLTLPRLKCLEITGFKPGTLVDILQMLKLVQLPSLIINTMNPFTEVHKKLLKKGWKLRPQIVPVIKVQEISTLSTCRSLKKLVCGFSDTANLHLLHNLYELEDLTITTKPSKGSLEALFTALASREVPSLQYFRLENGVIDSLEATELARITSLKLVECDFLDVQDIGKFSDLARENLERLNIASLKNFHETSPGILKVLQSSENKIGITTKDITIRTNRELKFLYLQMSIFEDYTDKTLLVPLASVEWVESLTITVKRGNLKTFFKALSIRTNLKKMTIEGGSLDFDETLELANMKSLKEFNGPLNDLRSIEHLRHLSHIEIGHSFGNRFPENMVDKREISFNNQTGRLTLCNAFDFSNVSNDIAPLANLKNLKSVRILAVHERKSLQYFMAKLALRKIVSLQELIIETNKDEVKSSVFTLNASELKEVTSIKSLRTLKCGFSDPKDLEMLALLPELTYLTVGLNQKEVLRELFGKLSLSDLPVPDRLPVEGTVAFEIGSQKMSIKEMIISKDQGDTFLVELFKMLVLVSGSTLQKLIIKGAPIVKCEADEISKIQSLQKLIYGFDKLRDMIGLLRLSELTTLVIVPHADFKRNDQKETLMTRIPDHISRDLTSSYFKNLMEKAQHLDRQRLYIELSPDVGSVKDIFQPLPVGLTHTLQELVITYRYLDVEEVERIAQIGSLKKLRCGFHFALCFSLLRSLTNLECLEIKPYQKFMEISDHLVTCFQECPKMQSIDLHFNPRVQLISAEFVERAIEALKLVRDPKIRSPLKL
ncbi:hypothetical protein KR084_000805, partial [Drosophila pseudotakahashii]